jgi:hypothetical protein
MSKTIVLTLELSDNINVNNIVDGFNEVIEDNLKYVNHWEWMHK